ncbi:hypothetical protein TIFTF001_034555 [Ficus carica]|uniref:Uncharacterized protein n=1 Tax=Ficus carica TaxID=3494 RepID=A0AA88E008_FICCA|nr:hypothetical protein TIFTF001_034534 [Ficus carica]GMN65487.1 hypothetical protein TIFTF001_034555 [Ficus carica]
MHLLFTHQFQLFFGFFVPVACPNLTPHLRRPCAGVSGSVVLASIPSSICFAAEALVCVFPSSLRTAFKLHCLAVAHSRQADASPSEVWEAKASLGSNNQLFQSSETSLPFRQFLPDSDTLSCVLVFGVQYRNPSKISFSKFSNVHLLAKIEVLAPLNGFVVLVPNLVFRFQVYN